MLQVHRGTVKFFNRERGFGFIRPNNGGKDIFFHVDYFSGVSEKWPGELEMQFDGDATLQCEYRIPAEDDEIAYNVFDKPDKGPMAVHWLFSETWDLATQRLAERPDYPANNKVRIIRTYRAGDILYPPEVVWEGHDNEFRKKLNEDLPEVFSEEHAFEELNLNNEWERMWHPSQWHPKYKRTKK